MTLPLRSPTRLLAASAVLASVLALSGCGAILVGGAAATTAVVVTDRRTAGEQVEDQTIEMKAAAELRKLFQNNENARVNATSYDGLVLLTGDVPTEADKASAEETVKAIRNVKRISNEIRIGAPTPISVRTNDTWITSKVRTTLINTKEVPSLTIVVTTERGIVYLLGKVTEDEGRRAARAAAHVPGVNKVIKLFEIVSPESVAHEPMNASRTETTAPAPAPAAATPAAPAPGVETMPVK
ncbi:MAG: BON domain-containing protein [Burkholderiaceae bacterium]